MFTIEKHTVPSNTDNIRLSDYAAGIFKAISTRKGMKKAIKRGEVWVNEQLGATGTWIKSGDLIELKDPDRVPPAIYELDFPVIYEDDFLAIINKPAGIVVSGNLFFTIQNAILHNLTPSTEIDGLKMPRPVHRLDKMTSGLLLIAKTRNCQTALHQQFEERSIKKAYQAIVIGKTDLSGTIQTPIEGKTAHTDYKQLSIVPSLKNEFLSWLHLDLHTGRTHQLRIHLSELGFPILGDQLYGKEGLILKHKGLFLCATHLTFSHPILKKEMTFDINPPNKFKLLMEREQRRWRKYNE